MAKTDTPTAPLRIGAKAGKLIQSLDLPQKKLDEGVKAAEQMARDRGDRILRDYYLYLALGMDMPERTKKEWDYFDKNGKEMPGAGAATTITRKVTVKEGETRGNAPTPDKGSVRPDPKPSSKGSSGQSKKPASQSTSGSGSAPSTPSAKKTDDASKNESAKESANDSSTSGLPSSPHKTDSGS